MMKEVISFLAPFTVLLVSSAIFFSVQMYILLKKHFQLKIHDDPLPQWITIFKDQLVTLTSSGEYEPDLVDIDNG